MIDRHVDKVADRMRDALSSQDWIPDAIRPRPKPTPALVLTGPISLYDRASDWVSRHKILTGLIVLTAGAVVYRRYTNSRFYRKARRAKRSRNGARLEVVVIAGSPNLPLTRSLSLDLERRGFVVYIVCNTIDDEVVVQNLSRPDIRPLGIDITDVGLAPSLRIVVALLTCRLASQRRCLDRTVRTIFAVTTCCCAWSPAKLHYPDIHHSHSISQLPDISNRNHPTIKFRRSLQHPSAPSHPHNSGVSASSHGKTHSCR